MSNLQIDHRLGRTICFSLVVVDRWTTTLQFQLRSASHAESSILVVAEVIACLSARLNYVSACPAASGKFCPTPSPPLPSPLLRPLQHTFVSTDVGRPPFCTVTRQLYFPIIGPLSDINSRYPRQPHDATPFLPTRIFQSDRRGRRRIIWIIFLERK